MNHLPRILRTAATILLVLLALAIAAVWIRSHWRTDMSVALPLLAQRMPEIEADGPGEWLPVSGNTGAISFPLRFRPEL